MALDFNKWKPFKGGEGIAMKTKRVSMCALISFLILLAMVSPWAFAEDQGGAPKFEQEELDQVLAPIALYPDSLLAQVLMAATYPLEVVEADRWVRANKDLKGDQLNDALDKMQWDPSVKALAPFPQVLAMMSEKLDWMQKLGDAFLAQEEDVMDAVQKLRAKAEEAGNLKTTNEQKVVVEEKVIRIEPASPEAVYVPVYNPVVVYGPWWYPAFPPFVYYPPGVVLAPGAAWWFGPRVFVGPVWSAWGRWDWHHRTVHVNINRNVIIRRADFRRADIETRKWQHEAAHRKGVAYGDERLRQRFSQPPKGSVEGRREFRGFEPRDRQTPEASRQGLEQRREAGRIGRQGLGPQKETGGFSRPAAEPIRDRNAFGGMGHGADVRRQSERGHQSHDSGSPKGRSGGGFPRR